MMDKPLKLKKAQPWRKDIMKWCEEDEEEVVVDDDANYTEIGGKLGLL